MKIIDEDTNPLQNTGCINNMIREAAWWAAMRVFVYKDHNLEFTGTPNGKSIEDKTQLFRRIHEITICDYMVNDP